MVHKVALSAMERYRKAFTRTHVTRVTIETGWKRCKPQTHSNNILNEKVSASCNVVLSQR